MSTKNIMIATANILCYKWKTLSNGECPLMLCVYKDGKRKYRSLGISLNPKYWDFEKNQLKANCPNRAYLNKVISDKLKSVNDEIIRLHSENRDLTATSILNICRNTRKAITVGDLFKQYIQRLDDENRRGYMLSVKQVYNSMVAYNGHLDIYFSEIDVIWLRNYETWLRKSGLAENTIGIRFRTLRAVGKALCA